MILPTATALPQLTISGDLPVGSRPPTLTHLLVHRGFPPFNNLKVDDGNGRLS